jgi:DNA-binding FrmR family transcriptional regulator
MNKLSINKAKLNLKKLRGQIDNIDIMIDKERDCLEIIQQINAAIGMFKKSKEYILEDHLEACLADKLNFEKGVEKTKFIKGLVYSFKLIN